MYSDPASIVQVIGNVFNDSSLLDETDKYVITDEDFTEDFHKIVFGSMYQIHKSGSKVSLDAIIDYLAARPKYDAVFKANNGIEYLLEASKIAQKDSFNYYYNRVKRLTLLRAFDELGINVKDLYDPDNVLDLKKKQKQEDWLDNTSLSGIADIIDNRISNIRQKYVEDDLATGYQAGDGVEELILNLEQTPEIGIPMYGSLINTITRGARLRKLYLRSGATGQGKTRAMIADACFFSVGQMYDDDKGWIKVGTRQPTLFIATEQDQSEVQTMMLAFISNVNEEHILTGRYEYGERERVLQAAKLLKASPLYIEELPDFSLQDVENKIRKNIREHDVKYVLSVNEGCVTFFQLLLGLQ